MSDLILRNLYQCNARRALSKVLKHLSPADSEQDTAAQKVSKHSGGFKVFKKILQACATCGDCPRKYRNWRCDNVEFIYFTFDSVQF